MTQTKEEEKRELKDLVVLVKRMLKSWISRMRETVGEKDYIEGYYIEMVELVERTGDRDDYDNKEKEKVIWNIVDMIEAMNEEVEKEVEKAKIEAEEAA